MDQLQVSPNPLFESDDGPIQLHVSVDKRDSAPSSSTPSIREEVSPEHHANFLSKILFLWPNYLFSRSKARQRAGLELAAADIKALPPGQRADHLTNAFEVEFNKRIKSCNKHNGTVPEAAMLSITRSASLSVVSSDILFSGMMMFISTLVSLAMPFLMEETINEIGSLYINYEDSSTGEPIPWRAYAFAGGLGVSLILRNLLKVQPQYIMQRAGTKVRAMLMGAIYNKSTRLNSVGRQAVSVGQILKYMQHDPNMISVLIELFHYSWSVVVLLLGYLYILYQLIDWATFVGFGVLLVTIPLNKMLMSRIMPLVDEMTEVGDDRVQTVNECLDGIQGVKMSAWEDSYVEKVSAFRSAEVKLLKKYVRMMSCFIGMVEVVPIIVSSAAILAYAAAGGEMQASVLFTAVTTLIQLKGPLTMLPQVVQAYASSLVSFRRIGGFLALPEAADINNNAPDTPEEQKLPTGVAIKVREGNFSWDTFSKSSTAVHNSLVNVNCEIATHQITAVIGPVGSGKSTFCQAILDELNMTSGTLQTNRQKIAYVAQTSWLFNGTIRENILFGQPYDESRYRTVLRVCQLIKDLDMLEHGDQTAVGEKGTTLSGGQKQRISIARAAYSANETVIMDDPLSALDPEVASRVFNDCIVRFMRGRTRIVVTNQLNFLPACHGVIAFREPKAHGASDDPNPKTSCSIAEQGTYQELMKNGLDFARMLAKFNRGNKASSDPNQDPANDNQDPANDNQDPATTGTNSRASLRSSLKRISMEHGHNSMGHELSRTESSKMLDRVMEKGTTDGLMEEEERDRGSVSWEDFHVLIVASGGYCLVLAIAIVFLAQTGVQFLTRIWLAAWSDAATTGYTATPPMEDWGIDLDLNNDTGLVFYSITYSAIGVLVVPFSILPNLAVALFLLHGAKRLHKKMLMSILGAPTSFFDKTPIGRIVARFTTDMEELDTELFSPITMVVTNILNFAVVLVTLSVTIPLFAAVVLPCILQFYIVLRSYRPVNRDLKRMEAIARSPVFAHFSETLSGLATIRAYGQAPRLQRHNMTKVDGYFTMVLLKYGITGWLSVRLAILGGVITVAAGLLAVFTAVGGNLSDQQAGVGLSYAMEVQTIMAMLIHYFAEMESAMVSVTRINYYSSKVEQEAPRRSKNPPPKDWPTRGAIQVKHLNMRYRKDLPLVLKDVSFDVQPGERIGVVGRTGSGKSSFMLCMLRLVEPEQSTTSDGQGPIIIDGIDICQIGLAELRKKISIVQQQPTMFSGTIRDNLDPFGDFTDAEIWNALEHAGLKQFVMDCPEKLGMEVAESGSNFSQGQRQLICLCRAILDKPKVLLLDEATSSLDFETDQLIQKAIRSKENFGACTILTIAHRINTIIDSDKILVLDKGVVAEFDSPAALLSDPRTIFAGMAREHRS